MPRQHSLYDGQTLTPFTVMTEFQRGGSNRYSFAFDTWISTASFNADGNEIRSLRVVIDQATGFVTANTALLTQLRDLMISEMGLGGRGFTLTEFQWFPVQKVLTVTAAKAEQNAIFSKRGADYDAFITANATLFDQLNAAAWTHAKASNHFLNAMTPAV